MAEKPSTPSSGVGDWDPEAFRSLINAFGPYQGAGIEVTHIADDASEVRVRLPLTESNKNLVGVQFGGSLYAMVDPHLMILLIARLGPEYEVWDKSAAIDFLRPGRGEVHATIRVTEDEVEAIREAAADGTPHRPEWLIEVRGADDAVVARVRKTLWVRKLPP